jgi:uncharacterized membrane protein
VTTAPARRAYLDWLRGFAVICMIEWHVLDSWTRTGARGETVWPIIQTIGGMAAPLFLFLAGLAVPFAIGSHERRGASPSHAAWLVQKRGWQVFLIAHLFRLQSFLTNPNAQWSSLLKPDILNILGIGLAATAWLCGRSRATSAGAPASRVRWFWWLVVPAAICLLLTPWSRVWRWPMVLHPRLEAYIRPVGGYGVFSLFPWLGFVPAGAFVGSLLAAPRAEPAERRLHWLLAGSGLALVAIGYGLTSITMRPGLWWTIEPWPRFLIQTGYMTVAIWASWLLMQVRVIEATSGPMILFGQTSLFVYWVHLELAFGVLSYPLHGALTLPWAIVGLSTVTIAMYFAARWWKNRPDRPLIPLQLTTNNYYN